MRGQGSVEYLVLLAMVLIVALIGVVLLGGLPIGSGEVARGETLAYWTAVRPFSITDYAQSGSTVYITLVNRETQRLILQQMQVGNVTGNFSPGWTIGPNSARNISIGGMRPCNATTYTDYEYAVNITYDTADISNRLQVGAKPLIGRCFT